MSLIVVGSRGSISISPIFIRIGCLEICLFGSAYLDSAYLDSAYLDSAYLDIQISEKLQGNKISLVWNIFR